MADNPLPGDNMAVHSILLFKVNREIINGYSQNQLTSRMLTTNEKNDLDMTTDTCPAHLPPKVLIIEDPLGKTDKY